MKIERGAATNTCRSAYDRRVPSFELISGRYRRRPAAVFTKPCLQRQTSKLSAKRSRITSTAGSSYVFLRYCFGASDERLDVRENGVPSLNEPFGILHMQRHSDKVSFG
jgi:hypothetical protein